MIGIVATPTSLAKILRLFDTLFMGMLCLFLH